MQPESGLGVGQVQPVTAFQVPSVGHISGSAPQIRSPVIRTLSPVTLMMGPKSDPAVNSAPGDATPLVTRPRPLASQTSRCERTMVVVNGMVALSTM